MNNSEKIGKIDRPPGIANYCGYHPTHPQNQALSHFQGCVTGGQSHEIAAAYRAILWRVTMTTDHDTSAKVSMIQIGGICHTNGWRMLLPTKKRAYFLQRCRDRNGTCIAIFFKSAAVSGRCDSPE